MKEWEELARKWIAEEPRYIPSIPPIRVYQKGFIDALEWVLDNFMELGIDDWTIIKKELEE